MSASTTRSVCLGLFAAVGLSMSAAAATRAPEPGLPANGAIDTRLGSADSAVGRFTVDLGAAFDGALPPIGQRDLEATFGKLLATTPRAREGVRIRSVQDVARVFGVTETPRALAPGLVRTSSAAFGFDPYTGVALFSRDRSRLPSVAYDVAAADRDAIAREHAVFLANVGIDSPQIQLLQTVFLSTRGEETGRPLPDATLPEVYATMTYAARSLAGVQVEGSYAKVASIGKGNAVALDLSWPPIAFHADWRSPKTLDVASLKRAALPVMRSVAGGNPANVLMAYVLRPVRVAGARVYVPALKIGVQTQSAGSDPETEGGSVLDEIADVYVDLAADPLRYDPEDIVDDDPRAP